MDYILRNKVLKELKSSYFWTDKTKENGKYISYLLCPECENISAFVYSDNPSALLCNHKNKCGAITKTTDLFPSIFKNIEKNYPATTKDPNRPAREYLNLRGLNKSLEGLSYKYSSNIRGYGGVMFEIKSNVWNCRIFDPPPGENKSHNMGSIAGNIFEHPDSKYDYNEEIIFTESLIDSLSLIEIGKQAKSILSANYDPKKYKNEITRCKKPIFAFDNDKAGKAALKKWINEYPEAGAILPIKGDWNDIISSRSIEDAITYFNEHKEDFKFNARLALVKDAIEYAELFNEYRNHATGLFIFNGCYWYSTIKKDQKREILNTYRVSNFIVEPDHFQLNASNEDEPFYRYYLKIKPLKGKPINCIVTANDISSAQSLTTMFLQRAKVLWRGDKAPSLALIERITEASIPTIRQLEKVGYDRQSNWYIFKNFAIDDKGRFKELNKKGFFEISKNDQVRPARINNIRPSKKANIKEIYDLFYQAWGKKASAAIAWTVASWFVHDIKAKIGFFPFLSLYGDTQTGKTNLAKELNAMQCLDEEGLPLNKENTAKGQLRKIAKRASIFQALIEAQKEKNVKFDPSILLPLYNDNFLQVRAEKTNDLQTHDTPFLSSLMFIQNIEIFKTKAQKERVISLKFKEKDINENTTEAFNKLALMANADFAYFFKFIMSNRKHIEEKWPEYYKTWKTALIGQIKDNRISENYAVIGVFHELLKDILKIKIDMESYIVRIAKKKVKECRHRDECLADSFFDIIYDIGYRTPWLDEKEAENLCYIHINGALKAMDLEKISFKVQLKDLKNELKEHPAYLENNIQHKFLDNHKAWKFDLAKIKEYEEE